MNWYKKSAEDTYWDIGHYPGWNNQEAWAITNKEGFRSARADEYLAALHNNSDNWGFGRIDHKRKIISVVLAMQNRKLPFDTIEESRRYLENILKEKYPGYKLKYFPL